MSLIPYSKTNVKLVFKPSSFFSELEAKNKVKERTLRSAYYRAIKSGLVSIDDANIPRLTDKGLQMAKPYRPTKLGNDAFLLISFDIPESERFKRVHLRLLLKELSCTKIQQSLWATRYDHRQYILAEIREYGLEEYVNIYESVKLPTK